MESEEKALVVEEDVKTRDKTREERMERAIALRIANTPYVDIAKELDIPLDTIKSWFSRGSSMRFTKLLYQATVKHLLSELGPKAIKAVDDGLDEMDGKNKFYASLEILKSIGKMYGAIIKEEVRRYGESGMGDRPLFAQYNIFAQEISEKSKELAKKAMENAERMVIDVKPVEEEKEDGTE